MGYIKHAASDSQHKPIGEGTGGWDKASVSRELAPKVYGYIRVKELLTAWSIFDGLNENGSLNDTLLACVVRNGLTFLGTYCIQDNQCEPTYFI